MAPVVQRIEELGSFVLGEGPHWDDKTQSLYFVDIVNKTIHKYVPSLNKHTYIKLDKSVSSIIPISGVSDRFVITLERHISVLTWDGISSTPADIAMITEVDTEPSLETNRINDAKADPLGNLWAGSMVSESGFAEGQTTGSLYSLDINKRLKRQETNIGVSNGIAWSKNLKYMYYIDSYKGTVDQYNFDASNLSISNRQTLFTFAKNNIPGIPDGQTIDSEGNLWVAAFQGARVIKISTKQPETLLDTVTIPDWQITSVAFGGPNFDELYVTSAAGEWGKPNQEIPRNGHIYKVTGLGVTGLPANRVIML